MYGGWQKTYLINTVRDFNFKLAIKLETARSPIMVFLFQNENPLAAKYMDRISS